MELINEVKVEESDLKLLEYEVKNLRLRSRCVLNGITILYSQMHDASNDAPNDEKTEEKRNAGYNRIDDLRVSIFDIRDILSEIEKYKEKLEKIIG